MEMKKRRGEGKQEPGDGTQMWLHQVRCFNREMSDDRWQVGTVCETLQEMKWAKQDNSYQKRWVMVKKPLV